MPTEKIPFNFDRRSVSVKEFKYQGLNHVNKKKISSANIGRRHQTTVSFKPPLKKSLKISHDIVFPSDESKGFFKKIQGCK